MEELNNLSIDTELTDNTETQEVVENNDVNQNGFSFNKRFVLTETQKKKEGVSLGSIIGKVLMYIFLFVFLLWTLFPLLIAVIGSFIYGNSFGTDSLQGQSLIFPVFRTKFRLLSNYIYIITAKSYNSSTNAVNIGTISKTSFIKFLGESKQYPRIPSAFIFTCVLVLPPTILGLFTSAMSAFAFSKLTFKGKNWMFGLLLSTMMIPGALSLAPSYSIYRAVLPTGSILRAFPLFVPGMFGAATCVFFLKQYFTGIPTDLIEAGKLDGMGYYKMFFKIIVPLSGSALIAQGILGFVGGYNDYFGPKLYLSSAKTFETIQIVLQGLPRLLSTFSDTPRIFASCMVALLPTLAIYFFAQRFFVEGIATSGMKI